MEFKDRLRQRRKEMEYTQDKLATLAQVSREAIINYENGRRNNPPIDIVKALADALDMSVNELLYGAEETLLFATLSDGTTATMINPPLGHPNHIHTDAELTAELHKHFDRLNVKGKKEAIKRLEELTEVPRYIPAKGV